MTNISPVRIESDANYKRSNSYICNIEMNEMLYLLTFLRWICYLCVAQYIPVWCKMLFTYKCNYVVF